MCMDGFKLIMFWRPFDPITRIWVKVKGFLRSLLFIAGFYAINEPSSDNIESKYYRYKYVWETLKS